MSLRTAKTRMIRSTEVFNVEDFKSIGFYLIGTGPTTIIITYGTLDETGTFVSSVAETNPTTTAPLRSDVQGFDHVRVGFSTVTTGNNGIFFVGHIDKVSNV